MKEADDLFKDFREHSVAEFFKKNRQMLGYSGKIKSLTTVVHEYITNAVDACEEAGILPEIFIKLEKTDDHYKVIVEDNATGIPKGLVGRALGKMLAGTKFHRFQQSRGQQGIGGAGCIMYSQITTGRPTRVITSQGNGVVYSCDLSIDTKRNEPHISNEKEYAGHMRGTRIETELANVLYQKSEYGPDEYIRRTALANPHARITYIDPDDLTTVYDKAVDAVPQIPKSTRPHPMGVSVDDLLSYSHRTKSRNVRSFLVSEFTRMSSAKTKEIESKVSFDMNKRPKDLTWAEAAEVVKAIKGMSFLAPPTDCLIPVSENHLEKSLTNVLQPEFKKVLTRPPAVYRGGVPFVVEVALAYGGKAGKQNSNGDNQSRMEVMRFANRVPLLFDAGGCAITKAVQNVDWKRYGIRDETPVTVLVNFTSIYVPYTGAGKQAIADEEGIVKEIRLALMDSARQLGRYVSGQRRKFEEEMRKKSFEKYIQETAKAIAKLSGEKADIIEMNLQKIVDEKYREIEDEPEPEGAEGVEQKGEEPLPTNSEGEGTNEEKE